MRPDFSAWMQALGMHGRQVSEAGNMIGIERGAQASLIHTGKRDLTTTERLAMAAVRAGLPAWTPETDEEISGMAALRSLVDAEAEKKAEARKTG